MEDDPQSRAIMLQPKKVDKKNFDPDKHCILCEECGSRAKGQLTSSNNGRSNNIINVRYFHLLCCSFVVCY